MRASRCHTDVVTFRGHARCRTRGAGLWRATVTAPEGGGLARLATEETERVMVLSEFEGGFRHAIAAVPVRPDVGVRPSLPPDVHWAEAVAGALRDWRQRALQ